MIAEESTAFPNLTKPTSEGGIGFDLKWNMGWMHDTIGYFEKDPIYRKYHHHSLTFGMIYQYSERFVNVFSHDEVVHGKGSMLHKMGMPHIPEKAANLRALYGLMWAWPGKNTLFMGSDFGQSLEWKYDASLEWHLLQYKDHNGILAVIRDLNKIYQNEPALYETDNEPGGFEWLALDDQDAGVIAFWRHDLANKRHIMVVGHYTPVVRTGYRVGVPFAGFWREIFNSDADVYGGTGAGNMGGLNTDPIAWGRHEQSLCLTLPGCSTSIFRYEA